jgi:hypothetical protein
MFVIYFLIFNILFLQKSEGPKNKARNKARGRARRAINRKKERHDKHDFHTKWKHEDSIANERNQRQRRPPTRGNPVTYPFRPTHYQSFQGQHLMFVGYELTVGNQGDLGKGLVAKNRIPSGRAITQYEGLAYTKQYVRKLSENIGIHIGSHFASPGAKMFVINGFALYPSPLPNPEIGKCQGTPIALHELKGFGGGSFCNHSDHPNAELVPSDRDDGLGLFIVAIKDIEAGEFITVNYSSKFLNSKWRNIPYIIE